VSVGTAGSLQRDLQPGDLVLCEAAVRDEGVSHHYLPPGRLAAAPAEMTAALGAALCESGLAFRPGVSWTIDAPYRETAKAIELAEQLGIIAVEMEAAALYAYATARHRDVICVAHVTNAMATDGDDFEKGEGDGVHAALEVVSAIVARLHSCNGGSEVKANQDAPSSSNAEAES